MSKQLDKFKLGKASPPPPIFLSNYNDLLLHLGLRGVK